MNEQPSPDLWIRSFGYRIHARKRGCEAVWRTPEGELVGQTEALRLIKKKWDETVPASEGEEYPGVES